MSIGGIEDIKKNNLCTEKIKQKPKIQIVLSQPFVPNCLLVVISEAPDCGNGHMNEKPIAAVL